MDVVYSCQFNVKWTALFLLSLVIHVCLSDSTVRNSLIAVETEEDDNKEAIVETEEEYDPEDQEVFNPTHQWQIVKPGQAVPAGLHMRLNLQTGKNEAKLLDDTQNTGTEKEEPKSSVISDNYSKKELKEALAKFKEEQISENPDSDIEDVKKRFRPIDALMKEFHELNINIKTDFQIMTKLINRFNDSLSTLAEKVDALYDLEYYVHQVDNAQDMLKLGALQLLIHSLNSTETSLIEHCAFVIGSALASNPKVQVEAFDGGALQKLLVLLATEHPVSVKKKALYAVSSLLRQFPYAQQQFLNLGGLQVLKNLFREKNGEPLFVRVITLLYDLIMEKVLLNKESSFDIREAKRQQYSQINLIGAMTEQGWCQIVTSLLSLPENDAREKVLRMISVLTPACKDEFRTDHNLENVLHSVQNEFQAHVSEDQKLGEADGYFRELLNLIHEVAENLKS